MLNFIKVMLGITLFVLHDKQTAQKRQKFTFTAGYLRSLRERGMVVLVHLIHREMENVSMMYGTSLTMHFTTFKHPAYQMPLGSGTNVCRDSIRTLNAQGAFNSVKGVLADVKTIGKEDRTSSTPWSALD